MKLSGLGVVVWVASYGLPHRTMEAVLGELVAVIFGCMLGRKIGPS